MMLTATHWVMFGLLLMGAEILVPGIFLLWVGVAAVLVGGLTWMMPLSLTHELIIFAILVPVMAMLGRKMFAHTQDKTQDQGEGDGRSTLNRRGDRMVGKVIILSNPIVQGEGKTIIGDSLWTVHGPDLPRGSHIKILRVEGNVLIVEKA